MKPPPSDLAQRTGRRRCQTDALLMFLSAVGILLASPTATRAESASAPDSARTVLLRFAVPNFKEVRVVTNSAEFLGGHGVVSPDGLRLRVTSTRMSSKVRLVPWAEIESVQVRKGSGAGVLVFGTLGLIVGSAIALAQFEPFSQQGLNGTPILLGLVGGATLGWLVDHPGPWRTVYP